MHWCRRLATKCPKKLHPNRKPTPSSHNSDYSPCCHSPSHHLPSCKIKGKGQETLADGTRAHLSVNPHLNFHPVNRLGAGQHSRGGEWGELGGECGHQRWIDIGPDPRPGHQAIRDKLRLLQGRSPNLLLLFCVLFSHQVMSNSLWPYGLQHARLLCPAISHSLFKLMSIESVMPSNYLILCHPLLLLPSVFPSIRVFSTSGGQSIRASVSTSSLLMNIQKLISFRICSSCQFPSCKYSHNDQFQAANMTSQNRVGQRCPVAPQYMVPPPYRYSNLKTIDLNKCEQCSFSDFCGTW